MAITFAFGPEARGKACGGKLLPCAIVPLDKNGIGSSQNVGIQKCLRQPSGKGMIFMNDKSLFSAEGRPEDLGYIPVGNGNYVPVKNDDEHGASLEKLPAVTVAPLNLAFQETTDAVKLQANEIVQQALEIIQRADPSALAKIEEIVIEPTVVITPGIPRLKMRPRKTG
jgi:hypothetical protein